MFKLAALCFFACGLFGMTLQQSNESFCETLDRRPGVCINIKTQLKSCSPLYEMLKNRDWNNLRKNICDNNNSRVCCPLTQFHETQKPEPEMDYKKHPNFALLPPLSTCGLSYSIADRIIGGNSSKPGEFPWMVRLGFQDIESQVDSIWYICGGTLISNRYVLTAAHCFKHPEQKLVRIVLGETDEDLEVECIETDALNGTKIKIACSEPLEIKPEEIIIHPGYDAKVGSAHDIALVRLSQEVNIDSYFTRPICLPFIKEYHVSGRLDDAKLARENMTLVSGWGRTNNEEVIGSSSLQFIRVPIQPHVLCRVTYSNYNLTKSQICAGGVKDKDSCLGDSGGPLFLATNPEKQSRSLRSFQLGIVSFGKTTCARGNEPVVYTRVRSFLTWILDNLKK